MMTSLCPCPAPVFARLPDFPSLSQSIGFQLTGLIIVFIALGSIWMLLEIIGRVFKKAAAAKHAGQPARATVTPMAPADAGTSAAVVAVITASVHQMLPEQPLRVVNISVPKHTADWALEGRRHIFSSHKVR
ncbi:MAG: OadG family protein [Opitutaceae bacterium]|jgi:Na+-transporting methylmalonyl-CoA/oxaloacetate decarboxylase gamma subunit|nr:OadG family protein [Opitutaceae bacterium]